MITAQQHYLSAELLRPMVAPIHQSTLLKKRTSVDRHPHFY